MTSGETARREPAPSRATVVAGIGLAAAWSVLRKGYQFDGYYADDQFWNALVIDRLHPGLLAADPVVALVGDRYESALFEALALAAPVVGLPVASFALFCLARVLACTAIYRLAVTLTRSPGAGVLAAFLLAGASVSYLGGIHFVETILTPRGFALPLGLFAVDGFLRRRPAAMAAWLTACLAVHPVSGLSFLGAVVFCGVCFGDGGPRRAFGLSLAALVPPVALVALWTGAGTGPLRFDPEWAAVVADTVGPWVYLLRTPGAVWLSSLWLPFLGGLAVARVGSPPLRAAFLHFAAATAAALALHVLLVDGAQLRPLLQAAPQRASVVLAAIAIVAVAAWVWRRLREPDPLGRVLSIAFLLAALLLADPTPALLLGGALFAAGFLPAASPPPGAAPGPRWSPRRSSRCSPWAAAA